MNQEVKNIFTPGPVASFRSARKISTYLVKAKLYPVEGMVGSKKCGKSRCQVCLNIEETDTFASWTTGKSFKINQKLNCDDKCLIYLLTCKCCAKKYVGEPTDEFHLRWNNYRINDRKNPQNEAWCKAWAFWNEGHSGLLGNVSITLIAEADSKGPKKTENYWMRQNMCTIWT